MQTTQENLESFHVLLMNDEALQETLKAQTSREGFVRAAVGLGAGRGLSFTAAELDRTRWCRQTGSSKC